MTPSEIRFSQSNVVNIHPVFEPPPFLSNHNIVPAHHPLLHLAPRGKRPVLDAVTPFPEQGVVGVFVFVLGGWWVLVLSCRERERERARGGGYGLVLSCKGMGLWGRMSSFIHYGVSCCSSPSSLLPLVCTLRKRTHPKLHRDPIVLLREQFLPQPVFLLPFPFLGQKLFDGGVAAQERAPVAPDGGRGVG